MNIPGKLVLASSIALGLLTALAVVAFAAGGPSSGTYTFTAESAFAGFSSKDSPAGAWVSVNRGMTAFRPDDSTVAATPASPATTIILTVSKADGSVGFGCFLLAPNHATDFQITPDLHSASLNTTLTAADQCPGAPRVLAGKGPSVLGGGGKGGGLPFPVVLNIAWNWNGVVANGTSQSELVCADYQTNSTAFFQSAGQTANGSISVGGASVLGGAGSSSASLHSDRSQVEISGNPLPACFGY